MSNRAALPHTVSDQGRGSRGSDPSAKQQTTPSGLELVSEVSDLAAGLGLVIFTLAPLALPALALTALVAVLLLIPAFVGAMLAVPFVLAGRWSRARHRPSGATTLTRFGNREAYESATRG